jgi:hypothetical protein
MLKNFIIILIFASSLTYAQEVFVDAGDGLIDPEFYKSQSVEIDGHLYNYSFLEHSPSCPCNNSD